MRANLLHLYGSRAPEVLAPATDDPALLERLHEDGPDIAAQVRYAATHEWATTVEDVVRRRTTLFYRGPRRTTARVESRGASPVADPALGDDAVEPALEERASFGASHPRSASIAARNAGARSAPSVRSSDATYSGTSAHSRAISADTSRWNCTPYARAKRNAWFG